jgi:hypothetical protein
MHAYIQQQLVKDRVAELRAEAQRARHQRVRRAQRASEADRPLARRQWRVLAQALMAR